MKIGIALAGGGIRGIAHAGALQALIQNGIQIDIIGGTSAGSMVASLFAMGYSPEEIYELFKKNAKKIIKTNSYPIISEIKNLMNKKEKSILGFEYGEGIEKIYNELARKKGIEKIEEIKMPLVIPTVDIMESKEYIFTNKLPKETDDASQYITNISIGKAVRASSSFPAFFNPCNIQTHAFMDGGALDNVPVSEVRKQGADKVIAIKFDADKIDEKSNVMDIIMKTIDIMGNKISEENLESSDIVLNVYTDKVGLLDIQKLDKCFEYGYEAVIKDLDKIKEKIMK